MLRWESQPCACVHYLGRNVSWLVKTAHAPNLLLPSYFGAGQRAAPEVGGQLGAQCAAPHLRSWPAWPEKMPHPWRR